MYVPYLSGPADVNVPLQRVTARQDQIFGTQVESVWDVFRLLSMDKPADADWQLLADYYSARGPGIGTKSRARGVDLFGIPGPYTSEGYTYYIRDTGTDTLGGRRFNLAVPEVNRGRVLLRQRHELPADMTLVGEIGYLSDRNYLEQYFKTEFDGGLDNETLIYLKQNFESVAWTALVRPRLNNFSYSTEWYPRGDLFVLSEPLFGGMLTWSNHSSAGYGHLRNAVAPTDPQDIFTPLTFVDDLSGAVLMTRHELDLSMNVGPFKIVPYALGEAAFWSQGFDGNNLDRFVGSAGVRGSIMFLAGFSICAESDSQLERLGTQDGHRGGLFDHRCNGRLGEHTPVQRI